MGTLHAIPDTKTCLTPWCAIAGEHPAEHCESAHWPTADHVVVLTNDVAGGHEPGDGPDIVVRALLGRLGPLLRMESPTEARALAAQLIKAAETLEAAEAR